MPLFLRFQPFKIRIRMFLKVIPSCCCLLFVKARSNIQGMPITADAYVTALMVCDVLLTGSDEDTDKTAAIYSVRGYKKSPEKPGF
ncbi:hypothetical protein [Agrobacterium rosae]|uniref:Uncharacterized protein n=1 Tax=Agrobacterium rosae TaxID=1972867 RepID=A0ABU4VYU0_9HYPH|nr:hypothetical protein [Agrobacterium rosae]KAA3516573.1 hypothetical protein DXM25_19905 [Agrobacterium rosae]MDX8330683.1 hypothetical protein [Agrobacterium rosae]